MERKAIIDIGSNSIKFFIAEKGENGDLKTVLDTVAVTRLGEGLSTFGSIPDHVMERNVDAVAKFAKTADEMGVSAIIAVGTMALRNAKNNLSFVEKVKKACNVDVKIIDGNEEASLSYLGAISAISSDDDIMLFDNGGGSTEFIFGNKQQLKNKFSINLGAVRITEKYFGDDIPSPKLIKEALEEIKKELPDFSKIRKPSLLAGIGGTVTTMASVKHRLESYCPDTIQGTILTMSDIEEELELFFTKNLDDRKQIPGLYPERAHVILGGSLIVYSIIESLHMEKLMVSNRGLRHGLALKSLA